MKVVGIKKERPIIFRGELVRAILEGRKTMTRRPVKFPKNHDYIVGHRIVRGKKTPIKWSAEWIEESLVCPFGAPGDRLYVRETFQPIWKDIDEPGDWETGKGYEINYVATGGVQEFCDINKDEETTNRCMPSIHMPRWASRILLEIVSISVERIQEITYGQAMDEGYNVKPIKRENGDSGSYTAKEQFRDSWNATYPNSWDRNDWVWVIEFKRIQP